MEMEDRQYRYKECMGDWLVGSLRDNWRNSSPSPILILPNQGNEKEKMVKQKQKKSWPTPR